MPVRLRQQKRVHQVVHKEQIADLHAIAVEEDGLPLDGADQEMRHPALVLRPHLVQAVNATHPKYDCRQTESTSVIEYVLIGCAFRTAIRAMKIQRALLVDPGSRGGIHGLVTRAV